MADEAKRDANSIPTLLAVSNADGVTPIRVYADPVTHRLLVSSAGGGTVTSVSVVSANGFAGSVATATTTPAITLSTTITGILSGNGTAISAAATTGSGSVVLATTPTLVTPVLGVATATSINKVAFTAPATSATLTIANGKTLTANASITVTGVDAKILTLNTSLQVGVNDGIINFGAASKTLTVNKSISLDGTDSTVMIFPTTNATIARTDAGQTFTGVQSMTSPDITTSLTTPSTTFALLNATATTVNAFGATTTLNLGASAAMVLNFGGSTSAAEFRFLEPSGSGTNFTAFKAQAQSANITYTLPATVASAGQVLTDAAGNGTLSWATPSGGTPVALSVSNYETAARYSTSNTNGLILFNNSGTDIQGLGTTASFGVVDWPIINNSSGDVYNSSPQCSCRVQMHAKTTTADFFVGLGQPTVATTGITFTVRHIGFKIITTAGTASLFATQADGTTENVSSALTTVADNDELELIFKVNGSSSVDYYFRKTGTALSSATNLTSNMPAVTDDEKFWRNAVSSHSATLAPEFSVHSTSYQR